MIQATHAEEHFTAAETVRDVVIGMADGLTVPFALAAGLAGSVSSTSIVIIAGLAEITAGSMAMGLGGYLAAKTDAEHYAAEQARELQETQDKPEREAHEVAEVFRQYGLSEEQVRPVVDALSKNPQRWVDFMMRFELGLEAPKPSRAKWSAGTIAVSYILGGFVPLAPYMFTRTVTLGLVISAIVTLLALFCFGFVKARFTGIPALRGALQTVLVGGFAAGVAFLVARLIA